MQRFYIIADEDLVKLEAVRTRLHSEDRLNGDQMRDLGHALDLVVRNARDCEYKQEDKS